MSIEMLNTCHIGSNIMRMTQLPREAVREIIHNNNILIDG